MLKRLGSLTFLLSVSTMLAQSPQGTITGTISDPTGAGVPGVTVTVKATATGLDYRGSSSADGVYVIPNLPVGGYELTATTTGFKSYRQTGLNLEVSQRLRVDITLQVGDVAESVDVTAEIPRVQTEDSSVGTVVEKRRIEELPLNGRHVFNLVKVVPGVQPLSNNTDGFAEISNQTFSQLRVNGGPAYGNQFYLDGVSNSAAVHNEISVVPQADIVEEFRVETNAFKAEFGQTAGGVVNVVTKAGGNQFHGSLYEFLRNDALDARNAFATQPDARTGRIKQVLRYNQYGGTIGGPVLIPKLYDGRNRTFFYTGYEQWRWRASGSPRIGTVAPQAWRDGDFSDLRDANGTRINLYDPATTVANPNGSGFVRQLLPGNVVPRSRQDPLALKVLGFMPAPNVAPTNQFTNVNNFQSLIPSASDQGSFSLRVDHRVNESDSLFFRYSSNRNTRNDRGWGLNEADPAARKDQRDNHNAVVNYTKLFNTSLLNDLRVGVTRQWLPFLHPSFDQGWPAKLGYPAIIPQDQFPPVQIAGLLSIGSVSFTGGMRAQEITQIADSLIITRGRHNFKTGFDLRWWRLSFINRLQPSGVYNFNSDLTQNPQSPAGTGFGMATYLLGEVSGGNLGYRPFFQFRAMPFGAYVQDDWKVSRTLTLNLGIRYDLSMGPSEMHNRYSSFDPFLANTTTGTLGQLRYAGAGGYPGTFVDRDNNNIGPRLGFAWDPRGDGKTAVRGGYGLTYLMQESGNAVPDNASAFGFSVDTPFAPPGGGPYKAFQFNQGPSFLLSPLGAAGGPNAFRGFGVRYQDRNAPSGYMQQWNFAVQRSLAKGVVVSLIYAGTKGTKLFGSNYNLNQLDPKYFSLGLGLQDQVANPFFGQITTGTLNGRTMARSQLLRPYPDYLNVETWGNHGLSSIYHSFQMTVEKRFSDGVSALLSYTSGKLITETFATGGGGQSGASDFRLGAYNRRLDRAVEQDDVSQRMVLSGLWELPIGKGRKLGGGMNSLADGLIGGWQLNGIWTLQTGTPLVVRGTNNFTGINYPDLVSNPSLPSDQRSVTRWFDTSAFRNPANFVIGNGPRTLPSTRGPGLNDLSFSLFKTFKLAERFRLEARGELFNALNTVNYSNPNTTFTPNAQGVNSNANFGRITSSLEARRMQLGLRLAF
ncbi:MAG: carboxypeptidase regulatory-like domain-containing protein [Bryobacterales bacterium]|nr:carboxypeptidase regulatory-like domain-containing protein [Bryobacterales bacterium]